MQANESVIVFEQYTMKQLLYGGERNRNLVVSVRIRDVNEALQKVCGVGQTMIGGWTR